MHIDTCYLHALEQKCSLGSTETSANRYTYVALHIQEKIPRFLCVHINTCLYAVVKIYLIIELIETSGHRF
jgi:hypothetical protein